MKIKLTSILASCLLTLCVSLPAFAMLGEEESDHAAITAVQDRFTNYQKRMHTLEEEKASLQGVKSKLENNLRETDEILGYVLEEATPTIIQYLRAISKGSSSEDPQIRRSQILLYVPVSKLEKARQLLLEHF
ncbi:MAG: hypothetical protein UW45_C0068G0007 [Parcubacteria group bacterium GW2011_GWC2_44_22]|nr:MAG: hypothetical protein UW45_C0068G0007 [Parcubacteria group bacterium GW2011_GWC2_44_22]